MRRGHNATLFSSWEPWSPEERARVRDLNEAFYATFVAKAAEGRKKKPAEIEAVAQGRVWTGREALAVGLVDRLGGLDAALVAAAGRARIPKGQEVQVVVLPQRRGLLEALLERQEEDVLAGALGPGASSFLRWAAALGDRGPIARVPFELAVR